MSKSPAIKAWIRFIAAMVAAGVLVYMSFLSLQSGVHLPLEVAMVLLALIFGLLYGLDELTKFVDAWRGGGGRND